MEIKSLLEANFIKKNVIFLVNASGFSILFYTFFVIYVGWIWYEIIQEIE